MSGSRKREGDSLTKGGDPEQRIAYLEGEVIRLTNALQDAEGAGSAAGAANATLTSRVDKLQKDRNDAVGLVQTANKEMASVTAELNKELAAPPTARLGAGAYTRSLRSST